MGLPVLFPVLFDGHPLMGRNHHALVDSQQLALMLKRFCELCKPSDERAQGQGGPLTGKRQRSMEDYFSSMASNKRAEP